MKRLFSWVILGLSLSLAGLPAQSGAASAEDKTYATPKAAFDTFTVVLREGELGAGTRWRIVRADNDMAALGSDDVVLTGVVNAKGECPLTATQKAKLYAAWQKSPDDLWLAYDLNAFRFAVQPAEDGRYSLQLFFRGVDYEEERARQEQAVREELKKISPSVFTQPGFVPGPNVAAYSDWRERFARDLKEFMTAMRKDSGYGTALLEQGNVRALKRTFARSIDPGAKGLHLRKMLIEAAYSRDRRVFAPGTTVANLLSAPQAKPVGYGGVFADGDVQVELWYMVFSDVAGATKRDVRESAVFSAFSPLELPAYKTLKRNSWPALVFVRDAAGQVKLYGLSAELVSIINAVFNKQIG